MDKQDLIIQIVNRAVDPPACLSSSELIHYLNGYATCQNDIISIIDKCPDICSFGPGISVKPDGVNDLDPCSYDEIETYKNVTVHVLKCKKCGHIEYEWERQENTEEVLNND